MREPSDPAASPSGHTSEGPAAPALAGGGAPDATRVMLGATTQLMWLVEPDGTLVEANPAALAFAGLEREEVLGARLWDGPWWESLDEARTRLRGALAQAAEGELVRYESDVRSGSGQIAVLDLALVPVGGDRGGRLLAEGRLITESAQARRMQAGLVAAQIGTWEIDLRTGAVHRSDGSDLIFGFEPDGRRRPLADYLDRIHADDRPRAQEAIRRATEEQAEQFAEFRVVRPDGSVRWAAARGTPILDEPGAPVRLVGALMDVTEQRADRQAHREQARALTTLNEVNTALAGELDLAELVQAATDAATALTSAQFGAFFYNVHDEDGEAYTLYTLSGESREAFEQFPMPRNTSVFGPTFCGEGIVRSDDITKDSRYGRNEPHHGMPEGHLPVRSYLAVPVISRSGEVHGGLFLGHERPGVFTEQAERLAVGVAAQAAVAIDNARLYEAAQREIAERKQAEAAVRGSEERFRDLILSLPAAVYTTDGEGRVTLFNERAAALWGRRPEIGRDRWCGSWRLYEPDGTPLPLDACPLAVALREGRSVRGREIVVERPDGTRSNVLPHPEPLRDASGEVVGAVNMLMDVTELKRADRDRALLAAIVESSDDAIISKTLDSDITSWNAAAERLLGYTAAEAVGQSVLMLIPPDRQDEEELILERLRRGESVEHFETVRLTKDGRALDVSLTISPLRNSDGLIVGASKILRDITAGKLAEKALRESEEKYRTLFESIDEGFCIIEVLFDEDGAPADYRFVETNPAFEKQTGLHDVTGKTMRALVPEHEEHWFEIYGRVATTGQPVHFVNEARPLRGGWYEVHAFRVGGPQSRRVAVLFNDVTERKRAEARAHFLAEAGTLLTEGLDFQATLRRVAHLAVPGFADWCSVNLPADDGAIHTLAVAHADPARARWAEAIRRRFPTNPDATAGAAQVIRTGRSELYPGIPDEMLARVAGSDEELDLLRQLGFRSAVIVPLWTGGRVIGALTFVISTPGRCFDEGDLAVAEELGRRAGAAVENARLHEALRESEARFRHLAEALPDIAYVLPAEHPDERRDTEYLNPRWYAYTGLPGGTSYAEAARGVVHPEDLPRVREAWAEATAVPEPMELEVRLRRHDGAYRWFLTRVVPVFGADGRVARWFGTSTDIHSQKAAEAELAERVEARTAELARSNAELDQFAYVASHDLKAPLRAIDNLAAWVAADAGPLLPPESKRHLELLQGRAQRMERLLSDLLAYSRAGRGDAEAEEVDVAALVREVAELLDGPPGIDVVTEAMPTLVTPRAPLEMVFRNLIGNALKHHDRPQGRVRVTAHEAGAFVTFSVEDDGPGIPARYHERIFGLFQTLRPRDDVEGSGVGLAVVKKAVESRGGTIRVEPAAGRGTTFTFTWPRSF